MLGFAEGQKGYAEGLNHLEHLSSVPEAPGEGIHVADVAVEEVVHICALPPQLGVKVDAACSTAHMS